MRRNGREHNRGTPLEAADFDDRTFGRNAGGKESEETRCGFVCKTGAGGSAVVSMLRINAAERAISEM
jgi:hypothetical protein